MLLYAQRKGIQSAEILYKARRCQGCYTAFCSLTVVEHIDQNILTLFVFQRNKMELHFLCVCSLTFHSCLDRCLTEGGTDHLFVCEWVGGLERACVLWGFFFCCPMWFLSCSWQHRKSQPWHFAVLLPAYLTKVVHSQVKFQWKRSRQRSLSHTHQKNESRILFLQKSVTWVLNNKNQAGFRFFLIASYKSHLFWPDRWSLLTLDEGFNDKDKYQSISVMAPSFAQHRLSLGECSDARVQIRICSLIVFTEDKNGTFVLPARECVEKGKPTGKRYTY